MGIGTRVIKNQVKSGAGDLADRAIDKGPVDKLEDKVDKKTNKMKRKAVKTVL